MGFVLFDMLSNCYRDVTHFKLLNKCNKKVFATIIVLSTLILCLGMHNMVYDNISHPGEVTKTDFSEHIRHWNVSYWKPKQTKRILMWTPFFSTNTSKAAEGFNKGFKLCNKKCIATDVKDEISVSDAVIFHASDIWKHRGIVTNILDQGIEFPAVHKPEQVWVFYSMEPVTKMYGTIKPNTFNWTMYLRRESTILTSYSAYRKKLPEEMAKPSTLTEEIPNYFKTKTKFAATVVSNCYPPFQRYRVIEELQKHVDLNYYGRCSGKSPLPAEFIKNDVREELLKDFKFYIALENSICRDYISEKFWNALDRRQIPVIAAPKYNLELLPEHSYLNLFDFENVKDLAEKMEEIGNNETLYNSFFDWTSTWSRRTGSSECALCEELHKNKTAQVYDIDAWLNDDLCQKPTVLGIANNFVSSVLHDFGL
ncbi:FUTC-like protein [Mya arenaria]|uniref:Fucosyltransferase n=1 Tax=Mya arenaria TaxID=6604 RepID=A0ABY7GAP7_MYAAR|nr:alpha-(1,3)-fucosyltransferase fut-3-like [Mya arenaria]XP_052786569.1 alpha-(1,3)-fucosyltransferase fut-3-like [Mya arenaria]WAR30156.1 FUTC-like protein [Mya arenaria]